MCIRDRHRLIVTGWVVRRSAMTSMPASERTPVGQAFRRGWSTLLLFVAVAVPLILTTGPLADAITAYTKKPIDKGLSIIFWIPVVLIATGLLLGRRRLPRDGRAWWKLLELSLIHI